MINFSYRLRSVCISSVEMEEMTADWLNLCPVGNTSWHYVGILQMKWPRYDDPDVTFIMFMILHCNTVLSCICNLSIDCNIRCFTFQMLENEMQRMLILNQFTGCLNRGRSESLLVDVVILANIIQSNASNLTTEMSRITTTILPFFVILRWNDWFIHFLSWNCKSRNLVSIFFSMLEMWTKYFKWNKLPNLITKLTMLILSVHLNL